MTHHIIEAYKKASVWAPVIGALLYLWSSSFVDKAIGYKDGLGFLLFFYQLFSIAAMIFGIVYLLSPPVAP